MVLAIAAAGPSGIFCRGPMKGLGMPGTGARIKRKPLRCQWKVASLPFLVRKATPAKVRADAQVARAAQVAHAAQEARLDRAAQEARLDRAAQEARLDRVAQEARLDRAAREARLARVAQAARAAHGPMKGSGPGKGATFSPENRSEPFFLHPKELRTPLGVSFARCIKPGVDTAGHSFFKMLGASAGDEHCYDLFVRLFDPMIARRQQQPPNLALAAPVEAANVVSVQVSLERNLSTLRFTPAMSLEERWKVEEILCSALAELPEDFAGEYFRLRGNHQSSGSRTGLGLNPHLPLKETLPELTEAQEAELSVEKWKHSTKLILFGHPDLRKPPGAFGSATATSPMSPARSSVTGGAQRSFPKEPPPVSLEEIPSLGERQLGEVQDETLLRLRRLLRHGDLRGAQRALQRAKLLNMETKEEEETVKQLESEGEFALLSS
eukprot:s3861_g3.t3